MPSRTRSRTLASAGATLLMLGAHTALAAGRAAAPPALADGAAGWTLTRLDLDITVDPSATRIEVGGVATLRLDADGASGIAFGLNTRKPVMRFIGVKCDGLAGETNLTDADHPNSLFARIALPRPAARGDTAEVRFTCANDGASFQLACTDAIAYASWVEGWYPAPLPVSWDDVGPSIATAPGETRFHLPSSWTAVSNGRLVKRERSGGGALDVYAVDPPVARSFIAGPYTVATERVGDRDIGVYLLSPKPVSAPNQARTLAAGLDAMEKRYGPYPYPSYAIAEIPEGAAEWFASSEQGFIMAKSTAFDVQGGNVPLFAHEAAHGWWGNLVNTRGDGSLLCSESLAQYSAVVAIQALDGDDAMNEFLMGSRTGYNPVQCAGGYFYIWGQGGDKPMSKLSSGQWDHNLSDSKGHWVYHMLRETVGDDVFFATLRKLIHDYAGKSMSLDDVRDAFLAAAPAGVDLKAFFTQWLDRAGAPVLDADWWSINRGKGAEIHITQRQPGEPFALPLEVGITMKDGATKVYTLDLREREQKFTLDTPDRPIDLRLDPNKKLLIWRPSFGPRPEPK